jgi:Flp pilus assembly protein TadG
MLRERTMGVAMNKKANLKPGFLTRFRKDSSGATAVEFAMIAPVFFLMLFVIVETGLMMFTEYVLQTSVQDAARLVRTGQAQGGQMASGDLKTKVCRLASVIINCSGKVTVYMASASDFAALKVAMPSYLGVGKKADGSPGPSSYSCGGPGAAVGLIATYDWDFSVPYFMNFMANMSGISNTRRLAGIAMFKNEPFPPSTTSCK